jgi:hypothetical protein
MLAPSPARPPPPSPGPDREVLVDHPRSAIQVTRRDMRCMAPGQWLNDEVINLYASLLLERDARRRQQVRSPCRCTPPRPPPGPPGMPPPALASLAPSPSRPGRYGPLCLAAAPQGLGPRCHFFSTFFANKLYKDTGYSYDQARCARCCALGWGLPRSVRSLAASRGSPGTAPGCMAPPYASLPPSPPPLLAQVRRWTLPKRLAAAGQASASVLDCDRIVLPVHQGVHWVCAVVDLQRRRLVYYDSLKVSGWVGGCMSVCVCVCVWGGG